MAVVCAVGALAGCGESDGRRVYNPEVRFEVVPSGGTTFVVESLSAGGALHRFPDDQEFSATGVFSFYLENGSPPYSGTFRRTGDGEITVNLVVTGQTGSSDTTSGAKDTLVLTGGTPVTPAVTPTTPKREVRFDVCALSGDAPTCAAAAMPAAPGLPSDLLIFGRGFTGGIGDPFVTRVISGAVPSIYFLDGARDNINGVFNGGGGYTLHVQLYVDGLLNQSNQGTGDVVLRADL
jgi:hypothetical protein